MKDNSKLFAKLKELNGLKEQNLIPAELYEQKSKKILEKIRNPDATDESEDNIPPQDSGCLIVALVIIIVVIILVYWSLHNSR